MPELADLRLAVWPIAIGAVCNGACALLGCFLVLRRLSMLGDAMSHAVLPGLVLAFVLTGKVAILPMFLGAMALGLLTAFLTHALAEQANVPEDAAMGIVFTSFFALGILLLTQLADRVDLDANCVLYGDIQIAADKTVAVAGLALPRAFVSLGIALALDLAFVSLFWKELKLTTFDPASARAMNLPVTLVHYLLMAMVAGTTVASFEAVGSILVVAMLVIPPATALLLTERLPWTLAVAVAVGVLASVIGYVGAYFCNTNIAGMMTLAAAALFVLALLFAPRQGLLRRGFRQPAAST